MTCEKKLQELRFFILGLLRSNDHFFFVPTEIKARIRIILQEGRFKVLLGKCFNNFE